MSLSVLYVKCVYAKLEIKHGLQSFRLQLVLNISVIYINLPTGVKCRAVDISHANINMRIFIGQIRNIIEMTKGPRTLSTWMKFSLIYSCITLLIIGW
jgi:hypothetical protein